MRKLLWTITLLVLGLSVGCGSKSEKIIVKYENWESLPSQIALHQAVVDAFNAGQEEIYVKLVPVQGGAGQDQSGNCRGPRTGCILLGR